MMRKPESVLEGVVYLDVGAADLQVLHAFEEGYEQVMVKVYDEEKNEYEAVAYLYRDIEQLTEN